MSQHRYTGSDLEQVLARVRRELGERARIVEANKVRSGGVGGFFARERFEVLAEPPRTEAGAPETGAADTTPATAPADLLALADLVNEQEAAFEAPTTVSTQSREFAEVLERVTRAVGTDEPPLPPAASDVVAAPPDVVEVERVHDADIERVHDAPIEPVPTPARAVRRVGRPDRLARLGLPEEYAPDPRGGDLRRDLERHLSRLPVPAVPVAILPDDAVVVVVGAGAALDAAARRTAVTLGVDADDVVVAGDDELRPPWCVVRDAGEARHRRRSWYRRVRPTVVALEAQPGTDEAWAIEMLEALEPTAVHGVVDATRKVDDVRAWCDALDLDTIELRSLSSTVSPAAHLALGLPITHLDDADASAAAWADLLIARVDA